MRRIAAVVLPEIACEIARGSDALPGPLAVVISDEEGTGEIEGDVGAVCPRAYARGVRPGMRVAEAMARAAELRFARLSPQKLLGALGAAAEVAMEFGATVEVATSSPLDTVWIDVTGAAHLFGGEDALTGEIEARMATLGHRAHAAIAGGAFASQALARFGRQADVPRVSPPGRDAASLSTLPVATLPIDRDAVAYFARLGVRTLAELARVDRAQLTSRLETFLGAARARDPRAPTAAMALSWLDGRDDRPLVPYGPPAVLTEEIGFDDGVETAPQLVFALRHAVSKLSARLVGRRQAANRLDIVIAYDRTIFRLRAAEGGHSIAAEPLAACFVDLPAPLSHTDDLFRAVKAKIERLELAAPAVRITLALSRITRAPEVQLDLSRDVSVAPDALPALLSELSAEIGAERVGVLAVGDDHRPEQRTRLVGVFEADERRCAEDRRGRVSKKPTQASKKPTRGACLDRVAPGEPARLLPAPVSLGPAAGAALKPGGTVFVGREVFVVSRARFDRRLDAVAWWSGDPVCRDYLRVTLESARRDAAEAWIYVDRVTGEVMLQGWWE